jgi:PKD repeat protein
MKNKNSHEIPRNLKKGNWQFLNSAMILLTIMFLSQAFFGNNKIKEVKTVNSVCMFRLKMRGASNYLDECVFYYQQGATDGFDSNYDAYKLFGPNPAPHISIDNDTLLMAINGISPVSQTYSTNILATTNITGTYTITAEDIQALPPGTCIFLRDMQTNSTVNLLLSSCIFTLSNTTTTSRFVMTITYNTLPVISNLIQPSCQFSNGGKSTIIGAIGGPWNYVWKDTLGSVIKTSLANNDGDSLDNLISGGYSVEISSVSDACLRNEVVFNINEVVLPFISFTSPDSIISSIGNNFSPTNLSSNCVSFFWDFGDGIGNSTSFQPTYSYSVSGFYQTKLVGTTSTGCKDSILKSTIVGGLATNIVFELNRKPQLLNLGNNQFKIRLVNYDGNELFISLISIDGKDHFQIIPTTIVNEEIKLDFNCLNVGLYILNINTKNGLLLSTKILIEIDCP